MAKDYLSSVLGIFDNTKELARRKAEEARQAAKAKAAQMAASAKKFVTQTAPQAIQKKSEQYIPGGIKGGVDRVKDLAAGRTKDSLFVFSPKTLNNQAKFVTDTAGQSKKPVVRAAASAYAELLRGKAKGGTNIQEGVKQTFQQPGWFNKAKGVAKTATGAFQFAQPDIAVATGPVRAAVAGGAGAIIRGAMAKIQGKDVAEEAGKGATEGVRFAAVTKFTDPLISKAASAVAPALGFWGKQAATRAVTGIGNVIEDEIITRIEQEKPDNSDRAISLAIGAVLGGNDELFDQAKRQIQKMVGNTTEPKAIAKATKEVVERLRDAGGKYAPEPVKPAVPEPKVDWMAPDPNKPNNLVRTIDGVPETPQLPIPKKPIEGMDFQQDPTRPRSVLRDPKQSAFGLMAGIEPEVDENGQPTGKMRYNPEKGLAGLAMAGFLTTGKHQESMKAIINSSKTPEEAIGQLKNYVETSLKEVSAKIQGGDTSPQTINDAKGLRAAINKLAYQIAGVDPAAGKQEKVYYEAAKSDPDAGPVIDELEWQITNVDSILEGKAPADAFGRPDMTTAPTTEIPKISSEVVARPRKTAQEVIAEATTPKTPENGAIVPEVPKDGEVIQPTVRKPKSAQEIIASQSPDSIPKTDTPLPSPAPKMQEFFQAPKAPDTQIQPKSEVEIKPNTDPSEISISRKTTQASPLNVNRLDLTDEQKGRVSADQIKEVRDILGDKEIEKIAKAAGIDTKTNSIDQTAEKIAGQLNVRRQVVELEAKRTEMIKAGASDEELIAIAKQIQDTSRISREQGTDIARQLSARRIIANEINTPMQRVFQLLDKAGVNPEAYTKDAAKLDFTDGNAVVDFYRKYVPPNAEDWLTLVRYNSMLSSPNTQINNFFSNLQGSLLVAPIEKEITAGIDAIKSALTGSKREYASGEGVAYAKGYLGSVNAAAKKWMEVMQGKVLSANLDYREVPLTQSGDRLRKTENILKFPMKTLEAFDQFFTTLTKGGSEKSLEFRAGKGIDVKDPAALAEIEAAKRLFRSDLGDNEGSVVLDAMDAIANVVQRLKSHDNVVVRNIARFSLPFLRTPTNILKQGLEYSPAGVLTMPGAKDKTEQLAKAVMGTSVGIAVATMVSSDRLTWAEPTSQKQKNAFRAAGMQPYSIKVGDKWISYSKVHPAIAFPMALVAAVKDSQENGNLDDTQADQILAGASKWVQFFADQSYVKSIGDLVAATKGDIEGPARMIGNYAQQLIPFRALSGWIARLIDPYQRKVDTDGSQLEQQFDYIKTQIPWASMTVPAREDQFGQPIDNQNRFMNAFSPNKVTIENPDAKKEFEWMQEQSKMDKEQRQLKEKLEREVKTTTTVPKAGAAESPLVPGTGAIEPKKVAIKELTKQEKTKVKTMLEYGKDVAEDDLVSYYLSDVKGESTDTGYKKSIRTKSLLTKYESIDADENLSKAQKEVVKSAIAAETGLTAERMDYYQTAKMDNSLKYEKAMEDIASFTDRKQIVQYLVEGRASVAGQMFASPGVIDSFYEDGYITKAEAKYLKALKWDETKKKMETDRDYKGSGTGGEGGMTKTEMKAFFKKLGDGPDLGKPLSTKKSEVDWSSSGKTSRVSEEDTQISKPKAYKTPETMASFFKPKATKLSTGEAQKVVESVRGRGPANDRLKLSYARVSR